MIAWTANQGCTQEQHEVIKRHMDVFLALTEPDHKRWDLGGVVLLLGHCVHCHSTLAVEVTQ